jgi:hypothetical protein
MTDAFDTAPLDPPAKAVPQRFMIAVDSPDGIIARPGDLMTCPDGHPVLRVVADVPAADFTLPGWFARLDSDDPSPSGRFAPCPTCGCEVCPPILEPGTLRHTGRYALFINGRPAREAAR